MNLPKDVHGILTGGLPIKMGHESMKMAAEICDILTGAWLNCLQIYRTSWQAVPKRVN